MLGIVKQVCPSLLNGKKHELSHSYVKHFMSLMGYSYCVATQSAKSTLVDWPELGQNMAIWIAQSIWTYQTPPELVINADQTSIHLLPSLSQTWNTSGDKQVKVVGKEEKHQVTLLMASTASGCLLTSQVIVPGKSPCSLPPPEKCHPFSPWIKYYFSGSDKHWSNQTMMKKVSIVFHDDHYVD